MAWHYYVDSLKVVTKPPKEDNVSMHVKISTDVELDPRPSIDKGAEPIEILENGHADLFAWRPSDMSGIDPKLVTQQKRKTGEDRRKAIEQETTNLIATNFIREVSYTMWLSNVVLVKKNNGKWRIFLNAYSNYNQIKMYPPNAYKTAFMTNRVTYCYQVMLFGLKTREPPTND
ncbi:hypothetical protein CR513_56422, partial [Mucuna pruriens]